MTEQKYKYGDLVHIAKELGDSMQYFKGDTKAIVIGSYCDQFGGTREKHAYTLHIKDFGEVSWYQECQLTLIQRCRLDLLDVWKDQEEADRLKKSDIDWIFSNGAEVLERGYSASIISLANCLKISPSDMWGRNGEGSTFFINCKNVLLMAESFLRTGDKIGWLEKCRNVAL